MGTLDVLTELVLEVDFFDVVLLIFFDVVEDVVVFLLLVTIFLELVELGLFALVVFFKMVLIFGMLVGFLLVEVSFFVLDDFWLVVAFFTICIFLVVVAFFVDVAFFVLVVFFVLVFFALNVFLLETARSSRSRFLILPVTAAELDDKLAKPVDDTVLLTLIVVLFENRVPLVELVAFGWYEGCSLLLGIDTEATIEDEKEAVIEVKAVSDVEPSAAEVEDDVIVEFE